MREAEVEGDPPQLFFWQTIRVRAGRRLDLRALAMIDVTGGGDDEVPSVGHRQALGSRNGAECVDHVAVLSRKNCPQVELELAARDVPDHWSGLLAQAPGQFPWCEYAVGQI